MKRNNATIKLNGPQRVQVTVIDESEDEEEADPNVRLRQEPLVAGMLTTRHDRMLFTHNLLGTTYGKRNHLYQQVVIYVFKP